jgi:hypothetical protein
MATDDDEPPNFAASIPAFFGLHGYSKTLFSADQLNLTAVASW